MEMAFFTPKNPPLGAVSPPFLALIPTCFWPLLDLFGLTQTLPPVKIDLPPLTPWFSKKCGRRRLRPTFDALTPTSPVTSMTDAEATLNLQSTATHVKKRGPYRPRSEETRLRVNQLRAAAAAKRAGQAHKYRRSPESLARAASKADDVVKRALAMLPSDTPFRADRRGLCWKRLHCFWKKDRAGFAEAADFVFNELRQFQPVSVVFGAYRELERAWRSRRIQWLVEHLKDPQRWRVSPSRASAILTEALELERELHGQRAANALFAHLKDLPSHCSP